MSMSKALKLERIKHNVTIQELSERMNCSERMVYNHMQEGFNLSFNKLEQYCNAIGCTLSELIETHESLK